ncbi:hypothetical protein [Anaerorhabdus sp.]|uniref:hypothetical protein n=1 Tax=Anaerorhabdus sp. TaxID=1872524 RepID=UPI002B21832C|nr:hypothetical protein [Anaerorhabdus sp.]MEA4874509.1 hypothetical protein [Anaerorhabdus sp.]
MRMFNENKDSKNLNKVIIYFHSFFYEGKMIDELKEKLFEYDFKTPNLYMFFNTSENSLNSWVKQIREYIYEISKEYDEIIIIGYSLGAILAGFCSSMKEVKKIILISPTYRYTLNSETKKVFLEYSEEMIIKQSVDNFSLFLIVYTALISMFEYELMNSAAELLFIQSIDNSSLEFKRLNHLFKKIENNKNRMICMGSNSLEILEDKNSMRLLPLLINDFLRNEVENEK